MSWQRDPESGIILPRTRRLREPRGGHCSMLFQLQQGQFGRDLRPGSVAGNQYAQDIYTNLVAWWRYEQNNTDTFWDDYHTGNHDSNIFSTSTTADTSGASGKINRYLGTNHQAGKNDKGHRVPRSDTAFDFGDEDFSVCTWFSKGGDFVFDREGHIIGRYYGAGATERGYAIRRHRVGGVHSTRWYLRNADDAGGTEVTHSTSLTNNVWYLFTLVHDSVNDELRAYIDTTKESAAHSAGVYSGGDANFSVITGVKSDTTYATFNDVFTENFDETFVTSFAMTDDHVAYVYNSGTGKSYSEVKTDAGY